MSEINRQWGIITPEIKKELVTNPTIAAEVNGRYISVIFDAKRNDRGPHAAYSLTKNSEGKIVSETVGIGRTEDDALGAAVGMVAHRTLGKELKDIREEKPLDESNYKAIRTSDYIND